ncbi:uncharacterized protein apof [Antennarius striatus]|uniref:uncharacterized protein apof n=1 Tax=Antennarius striatus TaxID=241820 RepID=UPI0035B454E2
MMSSKLKWLIVIQLLLTEQTLCRVPPPPALTNTLLPGNDLQEKLGETAKQSLQLEPKTSRVQAAKQIIFDLRFKLQKHVQNHLHIQGNVSCEEVLSASTMDDPSSSMFPQELLGLSLVPVLVVAGCPQEAQTLVLKLYNLLGVRDTEELLMKVESLIEKKMSKSASMPASGSTTSPLKRHKERHIEAVMFNIQQLAMVGEGSSIHAEHCDDWTRLNGTSLVGTEADGGTEDLTEAVRTCERLGVLCAGVTRRGLLKPGKYQAVLKKGSRILPAEFIEDECWIRQCKGEEDASIPVASGRRVRRSSQGRCINKSEERVYNVVEWIPAVSTLYNLGTAVYYASVNCSETAKERAILSAVDLGTDALMVATGGTAGVAGYALGAGVKTGVKAGVKYLLNSMKQEDDLLVNQFSWEAGFMTLE